MSIVFITPANPNPRFIKRMKLALEASVDTKLVYWDRGIGTPYRVPEDVEVYPIYLKVELKKYLKKAIKFPIFLVKTIKLLKKNDPKILHVGNIDMLFIAYLYKFIFNFNVSIYYEIGDIPDFILDHPKKYFGKIFQKMIRRLERFLCHKVDLLILTSPYFWDFYYSTFIDERKYLLMENLPSKSILGKYKKKCKKGKKITIGYIGLVRYKEQIKMLLDTVYEMKDQYSVLIAGGESFDNEIESYIEKNKYQDFVSFLGPYDYEMQIVSIYENIDIVYSVYDTSFNNVKIALPNKLYESVVCQMPIIVAKGTKLENFVLNNEVGFSVSDRESKDLKQLLENLFRDRHLLYEIEEKCNSIKEKFYVETVNNNLMERYTKDSL